MPADRSRPAADFGLPRPVLDDVALVPTGRGPSRREVTGVVLCGGRSSRMGRDKARLDLGAGALVERAARVLEPYTAEVWLACGAQPRYGELGLRLVLDEEVDQGPLGGLAAALAALNTSWAAVLACDMPWIEGELLERLLEAAEPDADVVLFAHAGGLEPLCALYSKRCEPALRAALAAGERRMIDFWRHELAPGRRPRVQQVRLADGAAGLDNLNTPEDLERALRAGGGP